MSTPAGSAQLSGPAWLDDQERRVLLALLGMQRQSWEQGVASHALLDLGLDDLADVIAHDAVARQTAAGKLAEIEDRSVVNSAAVGEVVLRASRRAHGPQLAAAFERQVRWLVEDAPRAADGTLFHLEGTREVWADTVYMVVPLLVLAGRPREALAQVRGHQERLFDPATGLYAHTWDEDASRPSRAARWGTGNGWVAAGLARALHLLGGRDQELAAHAAGHARTVVDACARLRRPDGLFHDVVDDPTTFPEANLGQVLAYAALTGAADGWLPPAYADLGRSLVATARTRLGPQGFVEGACGAPGFDRPGRSAEAQAFFLLAAAAERRAAGARPGGGEQAGSGEQQHDR